MTEMNFFGHRPPGIENDALPGRLIVIEATDAAGRSTHVGLLKEWLEDEGYAVMDTGLRRSDLAGPGIQQAKEGHILDPITLNLFYATDLWDRLERRILPGLRAGMVVIADRYGFAVVDARGSAADIFRVVKEEVAQVVRGMPLDNPVVDVELEPSDVAIADFGAGDAVTPGERADGDVDAQPSERSAFGGSNQRR